MTTSKQRARIYQIAQAIIDAEYMRHMGELDQLAALIERQRTLPLGLSEEIALGYLLATQAYTETTGEIWGA